MKKLIKGIGQVALLFVISMLMNKIVDLLHWKIPGSILGIVFVFILLQTKILRLEWVEIGASWLLAELLLFFVPSSIGVMQYFPMFERYGVKILAVVILSMLIVMISTGLLASLMAKRKEHKI